MLKLTDDTNWIHNVWSSVSKVYKLPNELVRTSIEFKHTMNLLWLVDNRSRDT